jgi:hypothetical protein
MKDETSKPKQSNLGDRIALARQFHGYMVMIRLRVIICYTILKIYGKLPYLCPVKVLINRLNFRGAFFHVSPGST